MLVFVMFSKKSSCGRPQSGAEAQECGGIPPSFFHTNESSLSKLRMSSHSVPSYNYCTSYRKGGCERRPLSDATKPADEEAPRCHSSHTLSLSLRIAGGMTNRHREKEREVGSDARTRCACVASRDLFQRVENRGNSSYDHTRIKLAAVVLYFIRISRWAHSYIGCNVSAVIYAYSCSWRGSKRKCVL